MATQKKTATVGGPREGSGPKTMFRGKYEGDKKRAKQMGRGAPKPWPVILSRKGYDIALSAVERLQSTAPISRNEYMECLVRLYGASLNWNTINRIREDRKEDRKK